MNVEILGRTGGTGGLSASVAYFAGGALSWSPGNGPPSAHHGQVVRAAYRQHRVSVGSAVYPGLATLGGCPSARIDSVSPLRADESLVAPDATQELVLASHLQDDPGRVIVLQDRFRWLIELFDRWLTVCRAADIFIFSANVDTASSFRWTAPSSAVCGSSWLLDVTCS